MSSIRKFTIEEINSMKEKGEFAAGDYSACQSFEGEGAFQHGCFFEADTTFNGNYKFGSGCAFNKGCIFRGLCDFGAKSIFYKCKFDYSLQLFGPGIIFEECYFRKGGFFGGGCTFKNCFFEMLPDLGRGNVFIGENECEFGKIIDVKMIDGFGSAGRTTYFWIMKDKSINVQCGCFRGNIDSWEEKVKEAYKEGHPLRKAYLAAGQMVKAQVEFEKSLLN